MILLQFQCGMRRPSLGHQSDDLGRLTNNSSSKGTSTNSSIKSQQQLQNRGNFNNNSNHIVSSYLPNILLNSCEWQTGRKRKERQDSTSSTTQDRKLVRSNSEEQLPNANNTNEIDIRRVSSHEDFNRKPPPLHLHNNENTINEETQQQNSSNNSLQKKLSEVKNELNKENGGQLNIIDLNPSPKILINHKNESSRHSPHRDSKVNSRRHDSHDDEEHERRRSNERSCRARVSGGRKSASPRKAFKYSPIMPTRYQHDTLPVVQFGGRGFGDDDDENIIKSKLGERIEDVAATDPNSSGSTTSSTNSQDDEMDIGIVIDASPRTPMTKSEPKPWESSHDEADMPVVCQRFAKDTFSHVNNDSMKAFIKYHRGTPPGDADRKITSSSYKAIVSAEEKEIMPNLFLSPDERIKQINKRLSSLKKKVTMFEEHFEREYGYRPSHADKTSDRVVKHAVAEIQKLRKEKAQIRADPMAAMGYRTISDAGISKEKKLDKLKETLNDIQKVSSLKKFLNTYLKRIL